MVVISRKLGDSLMIDDNIEVTVVQIKDDKVRLGITTPNNIPIHRKEVWDSTGIKSTELDVGELVRELERTKEQLETYKAALFAYAKEEWESTTQEDVDQALKHPFDFKSVIQELETGNAA